MIRNLIVFLNYLIKLNKMEKIRIKIVFWLVKTGGMVVQ